MISLTMIGSLRNSSQSLWLGRSSSGRIALIFKYGFYESHGIIPNNAIIHPVRDRLYNYVLGLQREAIFIDQLAGGHPLHPRIPTRPPSWRVNLS